MLANDWVAVVSYDTRLKVQQDFTHDRKALIAAIGDAVEAKDPEGNYASRIDASKGPSLLAGLPRGEELLKKTPSIAYADLRLDNDKQVVLVAGIPLKIEKDFSKLAQNRADVRSIDSLSDGSRSRMFMRVGMKSFASGSSAVGVRAEAGAGAPPTTASMRGRTSDSSRWPTCLRCRVEHAVRGWTSKASASSIWRPRRSGCQ